MGVKNPVNINTHELVARRARLARANTPENQADYLRELALQLHREADRIASEADSLLAVAV